jgi:hypothetical protein
LNVNKIAEIINEKAKTIPTQKKEKTANRPKTKNNKK